MSFENPLSVLYNSEGYEVSVSQSQVISGSPQPGLVVVGSGSDGKARFFHVTSDGALFVTGTLGIDVNETLTVSMSNQPTVDQGNAGTNAQGWYVRITDGTQVLGTGSSAPLYVTGSLAANVVFPVTQSVSIDQWLPAVTASTRDIGASVTVVSSAEANTTNFTLLTTNVNRKTATFFKEGGNSCFLKLGSAASSTSFTVKMTTNGGYYELPHGYTGQVDIIFNTAAGGNKLHVTEISY